MIECAFVFSISNLGFDNKINSPITVYVLQLRTFSWPTPLKYLESKPSTPLTPLKYPESKSKYLDEEYLG